MSNSLPSSGNKSLINDDKTKEQAEFGYETGRERLINEARETARDMQSKARPGGAERVANEQRLPSEGTISGALDPERVGPDGHPEDNEPVMTDQPGHSPR